MSEPTGPTEPTGNSTPIDERLLGEYAARLARLAEQHMEKRLTSRLDGEDVVQSVFRTFLRRSARGEFHIDHADQLWRLLVTITIRKARAKGRFHTAGVRNVRTESPNSSGWLSQALAREPDPSDAAALIDEIEQALHGLPDLHRRVLELRLAGEGPAGVADELGISRRTVYRALNLLQQRFQQNDASDG